MTRFIIHVQPDVSYIEQPLPAKAIAEINKHTSYELPGAWVSGRGPVRNYLFNRATQKFPTGLLQRVKSSIRKLGYKTKTKDYRKEIIIDDKRVLQAIEGLDYKPRHYQVDGIIEGIRYPYGLYWWPTGSGKTLLFSMLLVCYDTRALILTHRKELLYQLQRSISDITGREIGIIGDGHWAPRKWTVGIVNSFMQRDNLIADVKEYLNGIEYLICDEVHHLAAPSNWKIAKQCKNTRVRHGFSGTCFRTDNADLLLLAHTGDVISHYTTSYMIEDGWLSRPHIYRDIIETDGVNSGALFHKVETELIVNNKERNLKGCQFIYDKANENKQVLVMVKRVPHGRILKQMLMDKFDVEGRDIRFMNGSENTVVRERALKDYRYGVFPILIGTSIYDEGIDLPMIGAAANMAGGDSDIKTTQRLGRAIRKPVPEGDMDVNPEIECAVEYYDPMDKGHRFLKKHSINRQEVYEGEDAFVLKGEYNK
jgi:superfamily II DNA or RNA helicase